PGNAAFINAGAYVLEREVLDRVPAGRAVSFEREVFPALIGEGLYACRLQGYWLDIGTPERYLQATRDILAGAIKTARIARPIGAGSRIEDHTIVGGGAEVPPGSTLAGERVGGPSRGQSAD